MKRKVGAGATRSISSKGHFQEIGVDATTGKIIENKSEAKLGRD